MGGLERPWAKRVGREVEVWRYGRRWAELASVVSAGQRGWQRRRGKRHNLVNEGSGDYALRVASNRDKTGIRVRTRRTIEKGSVLKGRRDSRLKHAETGNLLNNGRGLFIRPGNMVTLKLVWIVPNSAWSLNSSQEASLDQRTS